MVATGLWRRGLPGREVVLLHIVVLLTAMIGGLHLIDLGPRWRMLCGLWTGHVALLWLVGGASAIYYFPRKPKSTWHRGHQIQAWIILGALTVLGVIFPRLTWPGPTFWIFLVVLGLLFLAAAFVAAIAAMIRWCWKR